MTLTFNKFFFIFGTITFGFIAITPTIGGYFFRVLAGLAAMAFGASPETYISIIGWSAWGSFY